MKNRRDFLLGAAFAVGCVLLVAAAQGLDPIFQTVEVDGLSTLRGDVVSNGATGYVPVVAVTLPSAPAEGDILVYAGTDLRDLGAWSQTVTAPSAATNVRGIAVRGNGDILIVDNTTNRIYTYSGGSWDSGITLPNNLPRGLSLDPSGNTVMLGGGVAPRIYTRSGGSWDSGVAVTSSAFSPQGVAVDSAGNFAVVDRTSDRVYTYDGSTWGSGFALPGGEGDPQGLSYDPADNLAMIGYDEDVVYTYAAGEWSQAFTGTAFNLNGLSVDVSGSDWVYSAVDGAAPGNVHQRTVSNPTAPARVGMVRFDGGVWLPLVQAATAGATPTTVTSGDLSLASGSQSGTSVFTIHSTGFFVRFTAGDTACSITTGSSGGSAGWQWLDVNEDACDVSSSWSYVTASNNPCVSVTRAADGAITGMWQADDPVGDVCNPLVGGIVVGPPPVAVLTGLYAASVVSVSEAGREALSAFLDERGWLGDDSTVSTMIADVPRDGCGTPDGDCRPAARLHALRALAEAGNETVFDLVARETRISQAGAWSVAEAAR